jgi:peptide methionine sulfoxide reductase msrA/msrB
MKGLLVTAALFLASLAAGGCSRSSAEANTMPAPPTASSASSSPAAGAAKVYAKPAMGELKARLTPIQFEVTQNAATEPPFRNAYWNNHQVGIYVDVATGEPLFSSSDKFESGTGWPSFTKPIENGRVVEHADRTHGMERIEVLSNAGGSHLGHVFDDGPAPTHKRYCMNSAALRFIPVSQLAAEGYGDYARLFESNHSSTNTSTGSPATAIAIATATAIAIATPPAATSNACALPPPGKKAGCSATLDVALFARLKGGGDDADDARRVAATKLVDGVLEVATGFEGTEPAIEVTFDPAKVSYATLLKAWTKGREGKSKVFARDDAQVNAASALHVQVVNAAQPFRRDNET